MNDKKKSSKNQDDPPLDYIKINQKNNIEELSLKEYISVTSNLLKSFSMMEDNIGSEINTFFNTLLPESKENDQLKLNILISSKAKTTDKDKDILENCLNDILNRSEIGNVVLSKELSEELSIILKEVYKKISKKKNIKNYEQLVEETKKYWDINQQNNDILKKYKNENYKSIKTINDTDNMLFGSNNIKKFRINSDIRIKESNSSKILNTHKSFHIKNKATEKTEQKLHYKFKRYKEDNNYDLPVEMLILIRKFSFVKKLKLILNNSNISNNTDDGENNNFMLSNINNNSTNSTDSFLEKNDVQNNILIFLNFEWLFPNIVEIEVDLSCENLTEYLINNLYHYNLTIFSKIFNRDIKITTYPIINSYLNNKRNYEPIQKSLFSLSNNNFLFNDEEHSSDKQSSSIISYNVNCSVNLSQNITNITNNSIIINNSINNTNNSFINNNNNITTNINLDSSFHSQEGKNQKNLELFLKKYNSFLEMIIIFGYFIHKMPKLISSKFILPLNLTNEISKFLKMQKVIINNFHFFSFINNKGILYSTIDFNSLDNQTFEKVLTFLNQNQLLNTCNISFFPPEEYFKPELLLKTLQNCDESFKIHKNRYGVDTFDKKIIIDIYPNESIDTYILRKLSKFFEKNLSDFFLLLTIKTQISGLHLFFDIPNILIKNGIYNNILLKFFINIFIFINNTLNNIKTLSLIAENFIFDGRKHPIIIDFLESLSFNLYEKDFKINNLTFQVRMFNIINIHKLISYNLTYLSLGSLDYISFDDFINFFTSKEFKEKSKLVKLKINLNNTVFELNKVYNNIKRLFNDIPKNLDEISIHTSLIISYQELKNLLLSVNYNQLINILMTYNIKSINKDKKFQELLENDLINIESDACINMGNMIALYKIKKNKVIANKIINLMINLKKKNEGILKYNIYSNIEKFLCQNERKNVIVQFK